MNKEDILAMPAGGELDSLVAEKVMEKWVSGEHYQIPCPDGEEGCCVWHGRKIPNYSTDISAAWEVVEKMKQTFRVDLVLEEGSNYCMILGYGDDRGHVYEAGANTAPESICKAALLAVMIN